MLKNTARKFADIYPGIEKDNFLKDGYNVVYGNYSSRVVGGVKARDATLHFQGKAVAWYDAATDEVFS